MPSPKDPAASPVVAALEGVTRRFDDLVAVSGLSLDVRRGEVLGLVGPNGAGKTTTVRMLCGLLPPTEGSVTLNGHAVDTDPLAARRELGYVPDGAPLYPNLSPRQHLLLVGRLHGMSDAASTKEAERLLGHLELSERIDSPVGTFSRGMRQKTALACALLPRPTLLVLDEPLGGLDAPSAAMLKAVLRGWADRGGAVLYTSHLLDVVERVCDRVAVMASGKLVTVGALDELRTRSGSDGTLEHGPRPMKRPGRGFFSEPPIAQETSEETTGVKLRFSRFEFKYVLPHDVRTELEREFQYFVGLDPYVEKQAGAQYFVRSLYFDNDALDHYWEKEDGAKHRRKFRLRTYTNDPSDGTPCFLEIKGRHNNLVFKHRVEVPDTALRNGSSEPPVDQLPSTLHGATTRRLMQQLPEGKVREAFLFDLYRRRLRPRVLVDYQRRPYVSKYDPEFRLTFDDSLAATLADTLELDGRQASRSVLSGYTILEVKFRFHLPKWFHRLIQATELQRVSISKYCASCRQLGLVDSSR